MPELPSLETATIRVADAKGTTFGAGFLVLDTYALTCAHVVKEALALDNYPNQPPEGNLSVVFHQIDPGTFLSAKVAFWVPPQHGDLAVLELLDPVPSGARPAPLSAEPNIKNHGYHVYGFPAGYDDGLTSRGSIQTPQMAGLLQLETATGAEFDVDKGYSGGPVWDDELEAVVGMITTRPRRSDIRAAFATPVTVLLKLWSPLAGATLREGARRVGLPTEAASKGGEADKRLGALAELMQVPVVRRAVMAFQADLQAASEQIATLAGLKHLHDLFQQLEDRYKVIFLAGKSILKGEDLWESVELVTPDAESVVDELLGSAEQLALVADEGLWTQKLTRARSELQAAIEQRQVESLKSATRRLNEVLSRQPSTVNTRLVASAGALRLAALVKAMSTVRDSLTDLPRDAVPAVQLHEFEQDVEALAKLDADLKSLVATHNSFQELDNELRRVEAMLDQDASELVDAWPDLKRLTQRCAEGNGAPWKKQLGALGAELENALLANDRNRIRRQFRSYRSQASQSFNQVDRNLLALCNELLKFGDPLARVLKMLQND